MKTQTIRSTFALSAPLPDTPVLPSYDPSLLFSYTPASITAISGQVTKWSNAQGSYGAAADLSMPSTARPTRGSTGVVFAGPNNNYISTPVLSNPIAVPPLTVLVRIKFSAGADVNPGTIFSGIDGAGYAYLRRQSNGTLTAGVNAIDTLATTATCASGTWVDLAIVFNGSATKIYINDNETVGTTGSANMTGLRIGANIGQAVFLNAEVSHLLGYSRVIGAAELKDIRSSL